MTDFETIPPKELSIESNVAKLKQIQLDLKQLVTNLHHKIEMLNSEPEFYSGINKLKSDFESKASYLDHEVKRLRQDLQEIKEILGHNLQTSNQFES